MKIVKTVEEKYLKNGLHIIETKTLIICFLIMKAVIKLCILFPSYYFV